MAWSYWEFLNTTVYLYWNGKEIQTESQNQPIITTWYQTCNQWFEGKIFHLQVKMSTTGL